MSRFFWIWMIITTSAIGIRGSFVPNDDDDETATTTAATNEEGTIGSLSQNAYLSWTEHDRLQRDLSFLSSSKPSFLEEHSRSSEWDARQAAWHGMERLVPESFLNQRLESIFQTAHSPSCRAEILQHLGYFVSAIGREEPFPFSHFSSSFQLVNTCPEPVVEDWSQLPPGTHMGHIQNRTYEPPRDEAQYVNHPNEFKLLYLILTHDDASSTIRLIEALQDDTVEDATTTMSQHSRNNTGSDRNSRHTNVHSRNATMNTSHSSRTIPTTPINHFIIHVDAKETSEATFEALQHYAAHHPNIHVLPNPYRVRINWGGFSMVNATLQMLQYATGKLSQSFEGIDFDKAIHLSATTYPLASNTEIRYELAKYPVDANFMNVIMTPQRSKSWNYFVECDDHLHRIFHLPLPTQMTHGFNLFETSQWWIISRDFAEYLSAGEPGSFVQQFLPYIEHVVVADENFFGTVLRNTEFCLTHVNRNYLHMDFDRWESDLPTAQRDPRKCMMKDPHHCGRSPVTYTLLDAPILELSDNLFARKVTDPKLKDLIDDWRRQRELDIQEYLEPNESNGKALRSRYDVEFEGHGVLLVAKHTVDQDMPQCLGLGDTGNVVRLVPCFQDWVPSNLLPDWYTGAVAEVEVRPQNRWEFAPCTGSHGRMERNAVTGGMRVERENKNATIQGPLCMLKQMNGVRAGRCFDGETGGGDEETHVFPCVQTIWGQLLSVGDGHNNNAVAPLDSLFFHIPWERKLYLEQHGQDYHPYQCLAVATAMSHNHDHGNVIAVPCNNATTTTASSTTTMNTATKILEFFFVPFIVELEEQQDDANLVETDDNHEPQETTTGSSSSSLDDIATCPSTVATISSTSSGDSS